MTAVEVTFREFVVRYGVLTYTCEYRSEVTTELVVRERVFAIVRFCGNPNEFFGFHEYGSRDVTVR
jgi:myosin heavy subunit